MDLVRLIFWHRRIKADTNAIAKGRILERLFNRVLFKAGMRLIRSLMVR